MGDELAAFSRSGWTKIAATGVERDIKAKVALTAINDWSSLSAQSLDVILSAVQDHGRLSFLYTSSHAYEPQERWLDPWGLVNMGDRLYLVGFDVDREDVRAFRTKKLSEITTLEMNKQHISVYGEFHHAPEGINLQEIVEKQLRGTRKIIDATCRIAHNAENEITLRAQKKENDLCELHDVDRDWLVRTAAALAPEVIVCSPADVVADVRALLQCALDPSQKGENCG
nr:WYL domain-containing protein [Corynebacterium sp. sy017]